MMKGKMTISKEEVQGMVAAWITGNVLVGPNVRLTEIKTGGYSSYDPTLEVKFTNVPNAGEGLPEGGE